MNMLYLEELPVCEKDESALIPKNMLVHFKIGIPYVARAYYCEKCGCYKTGKGNDNNLENVARELLPPYCSNKDISKLEVL